MKPGCSVFVGNIAFDIDEQKVIEELSAVGKVVSFKLVYDKATGKHKGYGFCEYESPLIAETAMKTLKISFNGRPVKINYAENDMPSKPKDAVSESSRIENIMNVLDKFDETNLKDVILYLKQMAIDQPTKLKETLDKHPTLTVAILTVFYKLNLIERTKLLEIIESSFSVQNQKGQIIERIGNMSDDAFENLEDDLRKRLLRLRENINNQRQ